MSPPVRDSGGREPAVLGHARDAGAQTGKADERSVARGSAEGGRGGVRGGGGRGSQAGA